MTNEHQMGLKLWLFKHKLQTLEKTLYMLTERLSIFKEQEDCLEKLEEAVCSVTTLLVSVISNLIKEMVKFYK